MASKWRRRQTDAHWCRTPDDRDDRPPAASVAGIADHLWAQFSAPIPSAAADAEVVRRDKDLNELDNVLSGSAWESGPISSRACPRPAKPRRLLEHEPDGQAILILDGLSLRESPWLLGEARIDVVTRFVRLDAGPQNFPPRRRRSPRPLGSVNGRPWRTTGRARPTSSKGRYCLLQSQLDRLCEHGRIASRFRLLAPLAGRADARPVRAGSRACTSWPRKSIPALTSDDFWALVDRLTTGRRLVITGDHGYAACGQFHDIVDKDQAPT